MEVYAFAGLETGALRTQMSQGGADNDFQSTAYRGLRWFSPIGKIDVAAGSSFTGGDAEPMILFTLGGQ